MRASLASGDLRAGRGGPLSLTLAPLRGARDQISVAEQRAVVQALYMGGTLATIVVMLLLLRFLDNPVQAGVGGLQPTAKKRSLVLIDETMQAVDLDIDLPCDADGRPA